MNIEKEWNENEENKSTMDSKYFPVDNFLKFDNVNMSGLKNKVLEFNTKLLA